VFLAHYFLGVGFDTWILKVGGVGQSKQKGEGPFPMSLVSLQAKNRLISFATTMQLMSKPIDFTINSVLILHVHVVATCNCICNYRKG